MLGGTVAISQCEAKTKAGNSMSQGGTALAWIALLGLPVLLMGFPVAYS